MEFNAQEHATKIIDFIRDYYQKNNLGGVVLGISGGKDSGVVAGLFAKAIGPENVIGVTLPCHSKSQDATDAVLVAEKFGFKLINLDLTSDKNGVLYYKVNGSRTWARVTTHDRGYWKTHPELMKITTGEN